MSLFEKQPLCIKLESMGQQFTIENKDLCLRDCYKMVHPRQSYGGFNPEIEDIVVEEDTEKFGHEDMDADISDQQMLDYMQMKRGGYKKQKDDSSDSDDPPSEKRKRFQKPDTSDVVKREV